MNFIFDFDGTICNSTEVALTIMNEFLRKNNLEEVKISELRNFGLKGVVKSRNVPLLKIPSLVLYGTRQMSKYISSLKTFPGMVSTLKNLSKQNFLAIITSNSLSNVQEFLKNNGIDYLFKEINTDPSLFGKDKKIRKIIKKYKLNIKDTYYIGDETRDVEAAKKVKIKAVAVSWGYESGNSLSKSKPDVIISKPEELLKLEDIKPS